MLNHLLCYSHLSNYLNCVDERPLEQKDRHVLISVPWGDALTVVPSQPTNVNLHGKWSELTWKEE